MKNLRCTNPYSDSLKEGGFTLIELMVVLAVLSLLAVLTTPNIVNEINEKRALISIGETTSIMDAARTYRSQKGVWPGDATCSNALKVLRAETPPYLVGVSDQNRYNSPYSTSCTTRSFSLDQAAIADFDQYLVNQIAGTELVSATNHQVRTTIGIPGSEAALDGKLSRLATGNAELNRMRTTLLLGGNDIKEVNNIEANGGVFSGDLYSRTLSVTDAAQIAGALSVKGESQFSGKVTFQQEIALGKVVVEASKNCQLGTVARDLDGVMLSCQKGIWKRTAAARRMDVTTGEVFNACIGAGGADRANVVNYDYPRYQSVCGSRYCAAQTYTLGFVTELGLGFNYNQPALSEPGTKISVQCIN